MKYQKITEFIYYIFINFPIVFVLFLFYFGKLITTDSSFKEIKIEFKDSIKDFKYEKDEN